MSKVIIDDLSLSAIADAIRSKNGENTVYKPSEMAAAINALNMGITPSGSLSVAENGTYDVSQYASVVVNIETQTLPSASGVSF